MLNEHFETELLCFNTDLNYEENYAKVNVVDLPTGRGVLIDIHCGMLARWLSNIKGIQIRTVLYAPRLSTRGLPIYKGIKEGPFVVWLAMAFLAEKKVLA